MGDRVRPKPRTRGEDGPDSSADEGLEVDLHVARCSSLSNTRRATSRRRRTVRSSDRVEAACGTDDGGHRSDPMTPAHGSPNQDRSPEASASPSPRPKLVFAVCLRALQERARSWPGPDRTRLGGPGTAGSPPPRRVRALRARLRVGDGMRERGRATSPAYGGTARAALIVQRASFRAATARYRFDPVGFRAQSLGSSAFVPRSRGATEAREGHGVQTGPRRSASSEAARGATPGTRTDTRTWTVEGGHRPRGARAPHVEEACTRP
jgi:hypothetical protein